MILISDPLVRAIPAKDNGNAIVDLSKDYPALKCDFKRHKVQLLSENVFLARKMVAEKLQIAQSRLPKGYTLLIKECYRPLWVQEKFWNDYLNWLVNQMPDKDLEHLEFECAKYVAPVDVAPHATGGAVDLTLVNDLGIEYDMGTEFNASPTKTHGMTYTAATNISEEAKKHRDILVQAMKTAGFVNYPTEWWHWSYGDKYWAYVTKSEHAIFDACDAG